MIAYVWFIFFSKRMWDGIRWGDFDQHIVRIVSGGSFYYAFRQSMLYCGLKCIVCMCVWQRCVGSGTADEQPPEPESGDRCQGGEFRNLHQLGQRPPQQKPLQAGGGESSPSLSRVSLVCCLVFLCSPLAGSSPCLVFFSGLSSLLSVMSWSSCLVLWHLWSVVRSTCGVLSVWFLCFCPVFFSHFV